MNIEKKKWQKKKQNEFKSHGSENKMYIPKNWTRDEKRPRFSADDLAQSTVFATPVSHHTRTEIRPRFRAVRLANKDWRKIITIHKVLVPGENINKENLNFISNRALLCSLSTRHCKSSEKCVTVLSLVIEGPTVEVYSIPIEFWRLNHLKYATHFGQ